MTAPLRARLESLDVFRGLAVAGMIVVNSAGGELNYPQLEHAGWNGLTCADLVFPAFLFAMGVSLTIALTARRAAGAEKADLLRRALRRSAVVFGLGLALSGFPFVALGHLRVMNVLQRIALCSLFASGLFLAESPVAELAAAAGALVGYWLLMTRVPVPGHGAGDLSPAGNLASYLDRRLLGGHLYRPLYDPEGLLSTLPALSSGIFGMLAGRALLSRAPAPAKAAALAAAGTAAVVAGAVWSLWFPVNKSLWTSSYATLTAGTSALGLAACYWLIEARGLRAWSLPFKILGMNALAAYVASDALLQAARRIKVPLPDGSREQLRYWVRDALFGRLAPQDSSLGYALLSTGVVLAAMAVLYRRRVFLKA